MLATCSKESAVKFTFFRPQKAALWLCAALLLTACVSDQAFREAREMIAGGQVDAGMTRLQALVAAHPENPEYRTYLLRQQEIRSGRLVTEGQTALVNEDLNGAEKAFRQALMIDRNQPRALNGLRQVDEARRHLALVQRAETLAGQQPEEALGVLRTVLSENPAQTAALRLKRQIEAERHQAQLTPPRLSAKMQKPVTLQFRDASISEVFQALGQVSGLSFVFDKDVPASKVTLFANQMSVEDALQVLLTTSQLEKKVLGENAILIYPNNPAKKADYQENIVKTFFIGNADPKQTMNLIKTMVRTRDVFIDEKLGLVTVRDTLDNIRIVERLIAAQDLIEPEVLLDVEVLEVATTRLQSLGIQFPEQIALSPRVLTKLVPSDTGADLVYRAGTNTLKELGGLNRNNIVATVSDPAVLINLKAQDGTANLLANPRIRVKNKEKAKIRIGDKVPVFTSTTAATGVSSQSVQYLDVGLSLDVDPVIHPDGQVSMKLALEVSNIVKEIPVKDSNGATTAQAYQIGSRRAETALRLKDGETQVLAGLISQVERTTASRVPGVGELPVLGRLFSSQGDNAEKTEIVLLVTPRIVRRTEQPPISVTEFSAGSDNYASQQPMRLGQSARLSLGSLGAPQAAPATAMAPAPSINPATGQPMAPGAALAPVAADAPPVVSFTLDAPGQAAVGQAIDLRIGANLRQDVQLLNLEIYFDPARFDFNAGQVGPLMASNGGTPQMEAKVESPGRLRLIVVNPGGAKGNGLLATLGFTPKLASAEPAEIGFGGIFATDVAGNQVTILSPDPRRVFVAK